MKPEENSRCVKSPTMQVDLSSVSMSPIKGSFIYYSESKSESDVTSDGFVENAIECLH